MNGSIRKIPRFALVCKRSYLRRDFSLRSWRRRPFESVDCSLPLFGGANLGRTANVYQAVVRGSGMSRLSHLGNATLSNGMSGFGEQRTKLSGDRLGTPRGDLVVE